MSNLRRTVLFPVLIAVLVAGVTGCGGAEQRKARHMQVGQTLYEQGEYPKAQAEFRAVLQIDAADVGARFMLGRSLEAAGEAESAAREYLAVLETDPGHIPSLERLSRLLLAARATDQAETLAQQLLARDPDNAVGLAVMAVVNASRGQRDAAMELAEQAVQGGPVEPDTAGLLAGLYLASGEEEQALALLERAVAENPDAVALGVLLAGLYDRRGDSERAEAVLTQMREGASARLRPRLELALARLHESNQRVDEAKAAYRRIITEHDGKDAALQARIRLARLLLAEGELDDGRALLAEVLAQDEDNVAALALRGRLALIEGDAAGAVADLDRVLQSDPDSVDTLKLLARAHRADGDAAAVRARLAEAVRLAPQDDRTRLEYARALAQGEEFGEALSQLDAVLERHPRDLSVLQIKARIELAQGDHEAASETAAAMDRAAPDRALGPYYAGLARLDAGEFEAGAELLHTALEREPRAMEPLSTLARAYLARDLPGKAEELLEDVLSQVPEHAFARNLLGEVHLTEEQYAEAVDSFTAVTRQRPDWWVPYRNLARAEIARGDRQAAIAAYRLGLENAESTEALVIDLALLYERGGQIDLAIETYESYLADHPGAQTPTNNLAMLLVEHRDDAGDRALELIEDLDAEGNAALLDTVGRVRLESGQHQAAVEALERAVALRPDAAEIRYHLAAAHAASGDEGKARRELEQALSGEPEGTWVEQARALRARLGDRR